MYIKRYWMYKNINMKENLDNNLKHQERIDVGRQKSKV